MRPAFLAGFLVLAGLAAVGIILLSGRNPKPAGQPGAEAEQSAPAAPEPNPNAAASAPAKAASTEAAAAPESHQPPLAGEAGKAQGDKTKEGPSQVPAWAKTLNDEEQPMAARVKAAKALASEGSYEAIVALAAALPNSPNSLRAAIAEALGSSPNPQSIPMLASLLSNQSDAVAMAAVRSLAEQGTPEAVASLSQTLFDSSTPLNVRCEAAVSLGTINQPGVVDTLARASTTITDEDVVTQVLNALGARPIDEVKSVIQNYISSPTVSTDMKVAAVEALGQAQGDASTFLASLAKDQTQSADVRAAAAWAMSTTETEGTQGAELTAMLQSETDPAVRRRLYQALGNQESFDVSSVESLVQKETDPSALVAGMDLLAKSLRENPSAQLQAFFDQTAAPELKNMALTDKASQDRMAAVIALVRAGTPDSLLALQDVAQQSTDPKVAQSARLAVAKPLK